MESARNANTKTRFATKRSEGNAKKEGDLLDLFGKEEQERLFGRSWGSDEKDKPVVKDKEEEDPKVQDLADSFRVFTNRGKVSPVRIEEDNLNKIRQRCILYLLNLLFPNMRDRFRDEEGYPIMDNQGNGVNGPEMEYTTVTETSLYYHEETETTEFSTQGTVLTEDGREIHFGLELSMSRSFAEFYGEQRTYQKAAFTDPLVINLDTGAAMLSDQKFYFDLDADGSEEQIAALCEGSGYLALDRNGNGVIDDGSELFGTKSGNGFADLSEFDEDHNGWIDENDSVWDKLLIWSLTEDGEDRLYTLKEKGVGALYLGSKQTEFSLNSIADNHTNGIVRSTGMFLYENGMAGTLQQLDLAT